MNETDKINLTDQTKFRLNEISKIENYFNSKINQRKLCRKKLSKYVTASDYINNVLIVLFATTGGVFIVSHATVADAPVGLSGAGFTMAFSLGTGIIKQLLRRKKKKTKKKKETKRKNMIKFLYWLKVNSILLKL